MEKKKRRSYSRGDEDNNNDDIDDYDTLLQDYDSIIRESSLLTTFTGILFGFLLNISVTASEKFSTTERIILLVSISSTTVAISLFILPVIYHHLRYPYKDLQTFKNRAHKFLIFGFVPTGITLYLCLELALSIIAGGYYAFVLAIVPFVLVYVLYKKRK